MGSVIITKPSNVFDKNYGLQHYTQDDVTRIKKALEHAYSFDNLTQQTHTSILFYKHEILPEEFTKATKQTQVEWVVSQIPQTIIK